MRDTVLQNGAKCESLCAHPSSYIITGTPLPLRAPPRPHPPSPAPRLQMRACSSAATASELCTAHHCQDGAVLPPPSCASPPRSEPMWRGRLRVIEKGSEVPTACFINLEDANSGELFAQSPYKPTKANPNGGCEAVLDSSRYFALTVVDATSGQKAYVGMGFPERTESFDFNVALQVRAPCPLATLLAVTVLFGADTFYVEHAGYVDRGSYFSLSQDPRARIDDMSVPQTGQNGRTRLGWPRRARPPPRAAPRLRPPHRNRRRIFRSKRARPSRSNSADSRRRRRRTRQRRAGQPEGEAASEALCYRRRHPRHLAVGSSRSRPSLQVCTADITLSLSSSHPVRADNSQS